MLQDNGLRLLVLMKASISIQREDLFAGRAHIHSIFWSVEDRNGLVFMAQKILETGSPAVHGTKLIGLTLEERKVQTVYYTPGSTYSSVIATASLV